MATMMNSNASSSSSSPCMFLIALLLASAASTGHAQDQIATEIQKAQVIGQVPCNGGSGGGGAAGVNVTLSCGQGTNLTIVAVSKTDESGLFNITVTILNLNNNATIIADLLAGRCVVYTTLPIPNCPNFASTGFLVAPVRVGGTVVGGVLELLVNAFRCLVVVIVGI